MAPPALTWSIRGSVDDSDSSVDGDAGKSSGCCGTILETLVRLHEQLATDLGPGSKLIRFRHVINLHKVSISIVYLIMMLANDFDWKKDTLKTHRPIILLILAMVYGILWLYKDVNFADQKLQQHVTVSSAILSLAVSGAVYYTPMYFALSDQLKEMDIFSSVLAMYGGILLFTFGIFFLYTGDCQKHYVLKYQQPNKLMIDGMFAYTRSPNFLGELLIFTSFVLLGGSIIPLLIFLVVWCPFVFIPTLHRKNKSVSRYRWFSTYQQQSGVLFPHPISIMKDIPKLFYTETDDTVTVSKYTN